MGDTGIAHIASLAHLTRLELHMGRGAVQGGGGGGADAGVGAGMVTDGGLAQLASLTRLAALKLSW